MGFLDLGARMTVVRLDEGSLLLISPITLSPELKEQIDSLGAVKAIIAPNNMHYLDLDEVSHLYPEARCFALPGVAHKVKTEVEPLESGANDLWSGVLNNFQFEGSGYLDEVTFYHCPARTLIVTDLSFNVPHKNSVSNLLTRLILGVKYRFGPTRLLRMSIRDRETGRAGIERILDWDFDRVIVTHGDIVEQGGKEKFRKAWAWLLEN